MSHVHIIVAFRRRYTLFEYGINLTKYEQARYVYVFCGRRVLLERSCKRQDEQFMVVFDKLVNPLCLKLKEMSWGGPKDTAEI